MGIIVRLSANNGPVSAGIRFMTWSEWSHCDFLLDDGSYLGAIPYPGVCVHNIRFPRELFLEYPCNEATKVAILDYAKSQIGKHYDLTGILGFIFRNRDWQSEENWFCSELVAASFHNAGAKLFDENAFKISPRDVEINPLFNRIKKPSFAK